MMKKTDEMVEKETEDSRVDEIPYTDDMKKSVGMFVESIIIAINTCELDIDIKTAIYESMEDLIYLILDNDVEFDKLPVFARNMMIRKSIEFVMDALKMFLDEIKKSEVMFQNRHVIANAIRGEMVKDDRSFVMISNSHPLFHDDISAYTDDPKVIAEYDKIMKRLKRLK
jgi:hypothetical protein